MNRLTPELWAHSAFVGDTDVLETRELDFNLARRSAVIINRIIGQMFQFVDVTSGHEVDGALVQEVDTDPDNVDIEFAGVLSPDGVVLDSSRVFRQLLKYHTDTAAGTESPRHTLLQVDWTNLPLEQRPISITPLRHHASAHGGVSNAYRAEVSIHYFIVELSLLEIGIINASRR